MGNGTMLDISDAIKSVGEAFTSLFNYLKKNKEEQIDTQFLTEHKRLLKAVDTAEKMFNIFFKSFDKLPKDDQKELEKLLEKFQENN